MQQKEQSKNCSDVNCKIEQKKKTIKWKKAKQNKAK